MRIIRYFFPSSKKYISPFFKITFGRLHIPFPEKGESEMYFFEVKKMCVLNRDIFFGGPKKIFAHDNFFR